MKQNSRPRLEHRHLLWSFILIIVALLLLATVAAQFSTKDQAPTTPEQHPTNY